MHAKTEYRRRQTELEEKVARANFERMNAQATTFAALSILSDIVNDAGVGNGAFTVSPENIERAVAIVHRHKDDQ